MRPANAENFVEIASAVFEILRVEEKFSTARPSKSHRTTPTFFAIFPLRAMPATLWQSFRKIAMVEH